MAEPFDDMDLMQYLDGELDAEQSARLAEHLASEASTEASDKLRALDQMSDLLSSYLELEADAVEPRLDAMWEVIERETRAAESAPAPVDTPEHASEPRAGLWSSIVRFFEGYRGYILTGALAAGATAAIILASRPPREVIIERPVAVQAQAPRVPDGASGKPGKPELQMVADEPGAPTVEELDVSDGSAMIFMMPGESEDDVSATVIYVDFNQVVEGPL